MAVGKVNDVAGASIGKVDDVAAASIGKISDVAASLGNGAATHSDLWVLCGNDGNVGYSTDAINWTIAALGGSTDMFSVAFANTGSYGDGLWVFARNSNTKEIEYITDNPPAAARSVVNLDGSRGARSIHYDRGGQKFMVGAKGLSGAQSIMTSSFGPDSNDTAAGVWSASASASDYSDATTKYGLHFHDNIGSNGAGAWMVGIIDDLIVSTDNGVNWALVSGSAFLGANKDVESVNYANGIWLIAGEGGKLKRTADNGTTWTDQDLGFSTTRVRGLAFGGAGDSTANVWMAVGDTGKISRSTDNGLTWAIVTSGHTINLNNIASNGSGSWVSVGNSGKLGYSTDDGSSWTFGTPAGTGINLRGVAINRMLPHDVG
jgi:hypothetical protein